MPRKISKGFHGYFSCSQQYRLCGHSKQTNSEQLIGPQPQQATAQGAKWVDFCAELKRSWHCAGSVPQNESDIMHLPSLRVSTLALAMAVLALPAFAGNVSVAVRNGTSKTISEVYIDGGQLAGYTANRLTSGRTIEPGSRKEFGIEEDTTCEYDLFARDSSGGEYTFRFTQCGSGDVTIN